MSVFFVCMKTLILFLHFLLFFEVVGAAKAVNNPTASAASLDYVEFQAVIKSAASVASLREGRASGRLDHSICFGRASNQNIRKSRTL